MNKKEPAKRSDAKEPRKRRRAIRSRRRSVKPTELFQQEPEEGLGEGGRPRPKGPGSDT